MRAKYIWKNGELCPWERAQVHVLTHALHYGSSVFEGLRAYEIANHAAVFCGPAHFERLLFSCKVARISSHLTVDQWMAVTAETLRANQHRSAYIRPLVFRGCGDSLGLEGRSCPVEAILATVPWGTYMGEEALQNGVDVQVSSWRRIDSGSLSAAAKIGGQYVNNQNIIMEAHDNGLREGIALDTHGHVSEGSGENLFFAYKNELFTPPLGSSIVSGITRNCVITIAKHLGYTVTEMTISREMLYLAEEIFFTGTAVEVCPVRSVDRLPVGDGKRGPITRAIQEVFFGIVRGSHSDKWGWLTPVSIESSPEERALS
jgi:branched-chain amino acid aminotransferase